MRGMRGRLGVLMNGGGRSGRIGGHGGYGCGPLLSRTVKGVSV
jgi:hypothetical protein